MAQDMASDICASGGEPNIASGFGEDLLPETWTSFFTLKEIQRHPDQKGTIY